MTNVLMPGSVPSSKYKKPPALAFKQMELIELFLQKAREFGVPDHEMFQTVDLYERQNLHQVTVCLQALGRKVHVCHYFSFLHSMLIQKSNTNLAQNTSTVFAFKPILPKISNFSIGVGPRIFVAHGSEDPMLRPHA